MQCRPFCFLLYCWGPNSFLSLCYALWPLSNLGFSLTHTPSGPSWCSWFHLFLSRSGCIYFLKWSSIDSLSWTGLTSQPVWAGVQIHKLTDSNSTNGSYVLKDTHRTISKRDKYQIWTNQNSDCIQFFLKLLNKVDMSLAAGSIVFLCQEWTTCRAIFFSPRSHSHQLLLHSSHTHATITSYDLCFLHLIYHCSSLPVLPRAPLGSIQDVVNQRWEKHTVRSHQPTCIQQQGQE